MGINVERGRLSIDYSSYSFTSQGIGAGTYYIGGYYFAPTADSNLNQAGATQTLGAANISYASHAFIVAKQAGTVDAGSCSIVVTGTSITDGGVRNASASETIVSDITTMSTDEYFETDLKFIGQVTYTLTPSGAATYAADFNYGLAKYEDFGTRNFKVTDFETVGLGGGADSGFNVTLCKHEAGGWTYSAAAFSAEPTVVCDMNTDHSTEQNLANGEPFAYKRDNLAESISGNDSEGIIIRVITGANNAVQSMTCRVGVQIVI